MADAASQSEVGRSDGDATLPGQACVHTLVMAAAPIELGENGSWDDDVGAFGQSGHEGGTHGVLLGTAPGQQ